MATIATATPATGNPLALFPVDGGTGGRNGVVTTGKEPGLPVAGRAGGVAVVAGGEEARRGAEGVVTGAPGGLVGALLAGAGPPGFGTGTDRPQPEHFTVRPASVAGAEKRLLHPGQLNERLGLPAGDIGMVLRFFAAEQEAEAQVVIFVHRPPTWAGPAPGASRFASVAVAAFARG